MSNLADGVYWTKDTPTIAKSPFFRKS